jgi:hypothetical protein
LNKLPDIQELKNYGKLDGPEPFYIMRTRAIIINVRVYLYIMRTRAIIINVRVYLYIMRI